MQKILRRVATAERVAAKRNKAREVLIHRKERAENFRSARDQQTVFVQDLKKAKKAFRDDWELGPLAPRQDVGNMHGQHGTIHESRYKRAEPLTLAQRNKRCEWLGGAYNLNIVTGDRVVLLTGPEKGRIGKIFSIDHQKAEVVVEGLNKSNIRMPLMIRQEHEPFGYSMELPVPISAIRLVHPIQDSVTGVTKDVIINRLAHAGLTHDRVTGKRRWSRIVPGLNIAIPWPQQPEVEKKIHKYDTLRIDVEQRTFVPTLLRPPMPEGIIDELRNKYSRFRTRHEPEYIARLEAEDQAKKDRHLLMADMRTPVQELNRLERQNKKKKGKPRLTPEMLEHIGRVIAKNRERTLNAAGVSAVSAAAAITTESEVAPTPSST